MESGQRVASAAHPARQGNRRDPPRHRDLRPGIWALGLWRSEIVIDREHIPVDKRRAKGTHPNAAMRTDPVGASVVFYDTRVKLEKV